MSPEEALICIREMHRVGLLTGVVELAMIERLVEEMCSRRNSPVD